MNSAVNAGSAPAAHDPQARAVSAALARVIDPCSQASGRPMGIDSLGLVLDWQVDEAGRMAISICTTFAGCLMAPHIVAALERELAAVPGVNAVTVRIDTQTIWSPERMRAAPVPIRLSTPIARQAWRRHNAATEVRGVE